MVTPIVFILYVKPKVKPKSELFLLVHNSKYKEKSPIITANLAIYGTLMELLTRFELVTSSLPRIIKQRVLEQLNNN